MIDINRLAELMEGSYKIEQVQVGAQTVPFHVSSKGATQVKFGAPKCLEVFSLKQIVNAMQSLIVANRLSETNKILVNAVNYDRVEVVTAEENVNGDREEIMCADFSGVFDKFQQGTFRDQDAFIIDLLSKFDDNPARQELLKIVGSVKSGETTTSDDDGVSQTVEVKAGVTLVKEQTLKNLWMLKPFKTFPEVEQPTVAYILRVEGGRDKPRFALFEADGGLWKVKATTIVREYLEQALKVTLVEQYQFIVVL